MTAQPRVKICGITRAEDRDVAIRAGANAIGFITDVPIETPRELEPDRAKDLVADVPPFVSSVLVTMPESVQQAVSLQRTVAADTLQIHGDLPPEKLGGLGERVDARIIAAVDADDPEIEAHAAHADAVLVDTTDERGAGGTGEPHDWTRTREHVERLAVPVVLAGGLTPTNVAEAIEVVRPYAVDTASGVERAVDSTDDRQSGVKDHDAMRAFLAAARGELA
jgi:phosphoribosylanthranilate isomerase